MSAGQVLQLVFSGLTTGSIYSLIALAAVLTYASTGVLNLALGEFVAWGALVAVSAQSAGLPLWACAAAACAACAVLGVAVERAAVRPVAGAPPLVPIITTLGASISLRGLALIVWGTHPYALPPFTGGGSLLVGGAALPRQGVWVMTAAALVFVLLAAFFKFTRAGMALRACMLSRTGARLVGISPYTALTWAFAGSGVLGALAGVTVAPLTLATYDMGFILGIKGLVAAIAGGMHSAGGAVLGGLALGLLEAFAAGTISSGLKDAIALSALIALLLVKPQGIFGTSSRKM